MDFDLGNRNSKLKKEQDKRKAEAKRKAQRERKLAIEAEKQKIAMEANLKRKREQELERERELQMLAEQERQLTGGISFQEVLKGVNINGDGDKVTLPVSFLETLTTQEIMDQGPMFFRISLINDPTGNSFTHAGMLEFTAEEGEIGLPPKIRRSLLKDSQKNITNDNLDDIAIGQVMIKYLRLEKGTFAKVQPKSGGLTMISEIRAMLEHNMRKHATLSLGDILTVWHRGKSFDLTVIELKPENYVTVIDTDLEIDLDIPEDQIQRENEEVQKLDATGRRLSGGTDNNNNGNSMLPSPPSSSSIRYSGVEESKRSSIKNDNDDMDIDDSNSNSNSPFKSGGYTLSSTPSSSTTATTTKKITTTPQERVELPPEPTTSGSTATEDIISCMVRKPDGNRCTRSFFKTDKMKYLFHFVTQSAAVATTTGGNGNGNGNGNEFLHDVNSFRLVTRFPRKVFTMMESQDLTFIESGLINEQEAFMLEVI